MNGIKSTDTAIAAATVVGQAITAYAEQQQISVRPDQAGELAHIVVSVHTAFLAGVRHATDHTDPPR
jgi:hypothetical protein